MGRRPAGAAALATVSPIANNSTHPVARALTTCALPACNLCRLATSQRGHRARAGACKMRRLRRLVLFLDVARSRRRRRNRPPSSSSSRWITVTRRMLRPHRGRGGGGAGQGGRHRRRRVRSPRANPPISASMAGGIMRAPGANAGAAKGRRGGRAAWQARCRPTVVEDREGLRRTRYAEPDCDLSRFNTAGRSRPIACLNIE